VSGKELADRRVRDAGSVKMLHLVTNAGQIVAWDAAFAFGFSGTFPHYEIRRHLSAFLSQKAPETPCYQ
jgi:hypothetical protein